MNSKNKTAEAAVLFLLICQHLAVGFQLLPHRALVDAERMSVRFSKLFAEMLFYETVFAIFILKLCQFFINAFLSNISHLRYLLMLCGFQSAGPREFFWQGHPLLDFPFGLRLHMSVSALRIRAALQFYPAIRFAFHHNTASCRQADAKRRGIPSYRD